MTRLRIADPRPVSLARREAGHPDKARDTLGRYELVRELAFGRFYSVYLAQPADAARSVVIKRLRDAYPGQHARARMLREARVGLSMRVPQLARVLELHDEPELFAVMEYVEGASLSELLARARGTDVLSCVVPVLLDALLALSALHGWRDEAGAPGYLVHQAPSSRHLLVGLDGVTRLLDLSNLYGRMLGTMPSAEYTLMDSELSPEQAARVPLDPRCDLFIVGTVLKHALAQSVRANLGGLREVCERATALRPSDRYWSADEMAHALEYAAGEAGLLASREQVARWVRLSRASLIARSATTPHVRLPAPERAKPSLPPVHDLAPLVLPTAQVTKLPSWATQTLLDGTPSIQTTAVELLAPRAEPPALGPSRAQPWLANSFPLAVAGLALTLAASLGVHAWREHTTSFATPIVAAAEPKVRPPVVAKAPLPVLNVEAPAPALVPEAKPVVKAPKRARAKPVDAPKRELAPLRRRAPAEPEVEMVLHEPEVLFYDEDAPSEPSDR